MDDGVETGGMGFFARKPLKPYAISYQQMIERSPLRSQKICQKRAI